MNALDVAITSKLIGDVEAGGVNHPTTGATGGFHQGTAPQTATFPRLHFQELIDTALYSFSALQADHVFYQFNWFAVDGNEEGVTVAGRLAERARTLFTDPSMSVTGKTLLYSRFERSIPQGFDWDDTNNRYVYSKGFILEVWLS